MMMAAIGLLIFAEIKIGQPAYANKLTMGLHD
jgi:hypothetical protein